jgi:hypothetical protein
MHEEINEYKRNLFFKGQENKRESTSKLQSFKASVTIRKSYGYYYIRIVLTIVTWDYR